MYTCLFQWPFRVLHKVQAFDPGNRFLNLLIIDSLVSLVGE